MTNTNVANIKIFKELELPELYSILALRMKVFCVEQDCPYQDLDGKDEDAIHVYFQENEKITAYSRILKNENGTFSIGRVVVDPEFRKQGLASKIMQRCIEIIRQKSSADIVISAQSYIQDFYYGLGFQSTGKFYLEDDIPHEEMVLSSK